MYWDGRYDTILSGNKHPGLGSLSCSEFAK